MNAQEAEIVNYGGLLASQASLITDSQVLVSQKQT